MTTLEKPNELSEKNALSLSEHERATEVANAMAEKFSLKPEEFKLYKTLEPETGKDVFTVAFAGDYGIEPGKSLKEICDPKNERNYTIRHGGLIYDARKGMTFEVYEQMVNDAYEGITKQEYPKVNFERIRKSNTHPEAFEGTSTWLTGIHMKNPRATLFSGVYGDVREKYGNGALRGGKTQSTAEDKEFRFRPAIRLDEGHPYTITGMLKEAVRKV